MDQQLLTRAQTRGGVFSTKDLREFGVPKAHLDQWLRRGEVRRLMSGGFALPLTEADPWGLHAHLQLTRVALLLEPTSAAAHLSALVAHRIELLEPDLSAVHVSRAGRLTPSHRANLTRHRMPIQAEVRLPQGVRSLDPTSALIQYCANATFEQAVSAMDSALHQDLVIPPRLEQRFAMLPRQASPLRLKQVLAASDRWAESVGESRARLWLGAKGYRTFSQAPVADQRGTVFARIDFQVLGTRVGVEFDGLGKYDSPGALVAEKRREDRIREQGYSLARMQTRDLLDPSNFLRTLQEKIRADRVASSIQRVGPCRYPERNVVREPHICGGPHS